MNTYHDQEREFIELFEAIAEEDRAAIFAVLAYLASSAYIREPLSLPPVIEN